MLRAHGLVRWGFNGWRDVREDSTQPNSLGLHLMLIDTARLGPGESVDFTFRSLPSDRWIGVDYRITVKPARG